VTAAVTAPVTASSEGCTYQLGRTSSTSTAAGGVDSVKMMASSGCAWHATSDSSWLAVLAGSGTGDGWVAYSVAKNTGATRTGRLTVGGLTFGVIICLDSTFPEPASMMASRGATALFIPTNNGLPIKRANPDIIADARRFAIARATENHMSVIRADVAGQANDLLSYGSSGVVDFDGRVLATARRLSADLVVSDIDASPRISRALD